jgi:hypothetical protein
MSIILSIAAIYSTHFSRRAQNRKHNKFVEISPFIKSSRVETPSSGSRPSSSIRYPGSKSISFMLRNTLITCIGVVVIPRHEWVVSNPVREFKSEGR